VPIQYSNPFTAVQQGLREALLRQEEQRRRNEADQLARDREERLKTHDAAQLVLDQENARTLAAQREAAIQTQKNLQADRVAKLSPIGVINPGSADVLREGGMGNLIRDDAETVTATLQDVDAQGNPIGQAETQAVGPESYVGTQEQQDEARKVAQLQKMYDEATDPDQKLALGFALGGKTTPTELIKDKNLTQDVFWASPDKKLIMKRNPATNQFEEYVGEVPKGSQWLQAPQPPSNVTISQFSPDAIAAYQALLQAGSINPTITRANAPLMNKVLGNIAGQGDQAITNLTSARAEHQADASALTQTTKNLTAIKAFENMAKGNIKTLKDSMKNLSDVGIPIVNEKIRAIQRNVTGNADVARFNTALRPVQTEVARILNGSSTLAGVVSVHAQSEVEQMLRGDYTVGQMLAALDVLEQDMTRRAAELAAQQKALQQSIRSRGSEGRSQGAPGVVAPGNETPEQRRKRLYDKYSQQP
jgi:hypothetical protein